MNERIGELVMSMREYALEVAKRHKEKHEKLKVRKGQLYTSNSVDTFCSGKDITEFVEMNEEIKDLMNAIDVTANLINLPKPKGRAYFTRSYPINKQSYHWVKDTIKTMIGNREIELSYPSFIWEFPKSRYATAYFIMECEIDHKLAYPIKLIIHNSAISRDIFNDVTTVEHSIKNDEQFIGHLKKILEGL